MEDKSEKRNKKDLIIMSILEFGEVPTRSEQELLKEVYQEAQTELHSFKSMYESSGNAFFRTKVEQNQKILSKINYKGEII